MKKSTNIEVYQEAIDCWGVEMQLLVAIEESSELAVAISHYMRSKSDASLTDLAEEMADVEIMIDQLKYIFKDKGIESTIEQVKTEKIQRLQCFLSKLKTRPDTEYVNNRDYH